MLIKTLMKVHQTPADVLSYHMDAFNIAYSQVEMIRFLDESSFQIISVNGKKKEWMYTIIFQKTIEE
jgi:hypothetical protein